MAAPGSRLGKPPEGDAAQTQQGSWTGWRGWIDRHIEDESQVLTQFALIPRAAWLSVAVAVALVAFEWLRHANQHRLLLWLLAVVGTTLIWLGMGKAFSRRAAGRASLVTWASRQTTLVICTGTLWGLCIGVFDVPNDFGAAIAVVSAHTLAALGGWLIFSSFFPALLFFSIGIFVPATVAYLWASDWPHAALCMVLHVTFVLQGRKVVDIIRIRHEKEILVQQLQQENAARQQALAAAQEATAAKVRFFSAISHDVRQPLYSLSLLAGAAAERATDEQRKELQQRMQQGVSMLDGLFSQLLEVSQLDAGALVPRFEVFELDAFMRETAQAFEAQARQREASLVLEPLRVHVQADRSWLQRITFNLIGNALNHAAEGKVLFFARAENTQVTLGVRDHGPGISADQQERIFEEFYRADLASAEASTDAAQRRGFGLGLPIARRLARAMGTDIWLRSQTRQGSTFGLSLPIAPSPDAPPRDAIGESAPAGGLLTAARIGVVEDDEDLEYSVTALLQSWGAQVQWARHSRDALRWSAPMEALIVDYQLTSGDAMTGVQVAQALLARWQTEAGAPMPVLIASSLSLNRSQTAGFDALVKPLTPVQLRAWLLNALASRARA